MEAVAGGLEVKEGKVMQGTIDRNNRFLHKKDEKKMRREGDFGWARLCYVNARRLTEVDDVVRKKDKKRTKKQRERKISRHKRAMPKRSGREHMSSGAKYMLKRHGSFCHYRNWG